MRKLTCHEAFHRGKIARSQYPLQEGRYKLEECRYRLHSCCEEIDRIRRLITRKDSRHCLWHCTAEDKHLWLKDLPGHIAHHLGYEVLPGLLALDADGAPPVNIRRAFPQVEKECLDLLDSLESVRVTIRRSIGVEYWYMKQGGSMLEPLAQRAIDITERALRVLPRLAP